MKTSGAYNRKKHILIYSIPTLLAKVISFSFIPISTYYLSPEEIGVVELILTVVTITSILISFGWDSALTRYLSDQQNNLEKYHWIASILTIRLGGYLLILPFFLFSGQSLVKVIGLPIQYLPLLWLAVATSILADLIRAVQLVFRAHQKSVEFAITEVSLTITRFLVSIIAVAVLQLGVIGLLSAQFIAGLLVFGLVLWRIRRNMRWAFPQRRLIKAALQFGLPLVPAAIALGITNWSDRLMLIHLLPKDSALVEIGIYSIAVKFSGILLLGFAGFRTWWAPYVYNHYRESSAPRDFGNILESYFLILFLTSLPIILFNQDFISLIVPIEYHSASVLISLMTLGNVIYMFGDYSAIGIGISKKNHIRMIGGLGLSTVNVVLNFYLIQRYGTLGAVIATAISYLVYGLYLQTYSQRLFKLPIRYPAIILLGIFLSSMIFSLEWSLLFRIMLFFIGFFLSFICFPKKYQLLMHKISNTVKIKFRK